MAELFPPKTNEEHAQVLANELPNSRDFGAKNISDSNFRAYLSIFAPEMATYEQTMLEVAREIDINESTVYLSNWEKAMGIPDDCFPGTGTLEERRLHVIIKLACMNVSTEEDLIELAAKLGKTITIEPIAPKFFPPYDIPMIPIGLPQARFKWIVRGDDIAPAFPPYPIPHFLETGDVILNCVILKVKPAYIDILFLNPGQDLPSLGTAYSTAFSSAYGE